jgi:hypothetical protein
MSNFRTKLFGLAAMATLFAGASYGQITGCATQLATTVAGNLVSTGATNPGPSTMRAEGTTELAGDLQFGCVSSGATTTGTLTVFTSAPATSKVTVAATGTTEAALFICALASPTSTAVVAANSCSTPNIGFATGVTAGPYYGTITGNTISFSGITLPATAFLARIANVRMNANAVALTTTLTAVTEQILMSANNTSSSFAVAATVGYVFQSLQTTTLRPNPTSNTAPTVTNYTTCGGNAFSATTAIKASYLVEVKGLFAGAFKLKAGGAATVQDPGGSASEGGTYTNGDLTTGVATSGTQLQLVFNNVPSAVTLYLPTSVTNNTLTLTAVGATGTAVTASTAVGAPGALTAAQFGAAFPNSLFPAATESMTATAGFTPTSGSVTVIYAVTATDKTIANEQADIPVYYSFAPGAITTAQGSMTLLEGYNPQATQANATTIPNFAPQTTAAAATTAVTLCSTNLLFPFVTSALGFDTGIALADTSADPFGTTASPGSCNLNFYGTGAPTPSTNVTAPGGAQAAGSVVGFLLSGVAPNFTGYMIANCSYQFGHGFAYIINGGVGNASSTAMGYVASVLERPNGTAGSETLGN